MGGTFISHVIYCFLYTYSSLLQLRTPLPRDYESEKVRPELHPCADDHPLASVAPSVVKETPVQPVKEAEVKTNTIIIDPLGASGIDDPLNANSIADPLGSNVPFVPFSSFQPDLDENPNDSGETTLSWAPKKGEILMKYTTNESIAIPYVA